MAVIDQYFQALVEQGASDLHLSQGSPPKLRLHGNIVPMNEGILTKDKIIPMLQEICDPGAWEKYMKRGDLDFAYAMDEDSRFRCNYLKQSHGLAAVFRLIPTKIASLEQLGIPSVVKEFGHLRSGLVLVTGPTGSGKSTTLAALIDYININFARHL
ncbi:MAG: type IV pilus twitching motility protein PilT, partial [Verrucomicrobiales bacterium]